MGDFRAQSGAAWRTLFVFDVSGFLFEAAIEESSPLMRLTSEFVRAQGAETLAIALSRKPDVNRKNTAIVNHGDAPTIKLRCQRLAAERFPHADLIGV